MTRAIVAGGGMVPFGRYPDRSIADLGAEAAFAALADANTTWQATEVMYCGAAGAGMTPGTRVGAEMGLTGAPIINVENASASGSSAFRSACMEVTSGNVEIALAVGVGKFGNMLAELHVLGRDHSVLVVHRLSRFGCSGLTVRSTGGIPAAVASSGFICCPGYLGVRRLAVIEAVLHGSPVAAPRFAHVQRTKLCRALSAELARRVHVGGQRRVHLAGHLEPGALAFRGEVLNQPKVRHAGSSSRRCTVCGRPKLIVSP